MRVLLECLFDAASRLTTSEDERHQLDLARRASLALLVLDDLEERALVVRVLEQLGTLSAIADGIADDRLVPFPRDRRRQDDEGPEPFLID